MALAVVTFAILYWVDRAWHEESMLKEMSNVSSFVAELLQLAVEEPMKQGNDQGTTHQFAALSRFKNVRICLTDHQGHVTYATDPGVLRAKVSDVYPVEYLRRLFVAPLRDAVDHREVVTVDNRPFFLKVEAVPNGPSCHHCHGKSKPYLGAVVLFSDINDQITALEQFNLARSQLLLLSLVGLLVALLLYLNRFVIKRLAALEQKTSEVMAGKLDVVFDVGGNDELARLGAHLTKMVGMRRRAETVLETLNRNLESVVRERTGELEAKAAEVERAYAQLAELDRMKTAFIATVSHELRTPLTSVFGFTRLVRRRLRQKVRPALLAHDPELAPLVDQMMEDLSVMLGEGERLSGLINNIIIMADLVAGRREWSLDNVDVNSVIEQVATATSRRMAEKGLALHWSPGSPLHARTDRMGLLQIMVNLLDNAIKFTAEGSVTIRAVRQDETVRVEVEDTGPGIPPEDRQTVFVSFTQLGDYLVEKPGGVGLGLAVCKEIASQIGARLHVEEATGGGSVFVVTLPLASH
ncbi:MAG: ATP-binding protein [Desulfovibrionaceae bacterium]